jgi:protein ImuA
MVAATAIGLLGSSGSSIFWIRTQRAASRIGIVQGAGWAAMGGEPAALILIIARDIREQMIAAADIARAAAGAIIIVEMHGAAPEMDLTASRRPG